MVKSPMEYFQEQDFSVEAASGGDMSPAERAFLKKYLGIDDPSLLQGLAPVDGTPVAGLALGAVREAAARATLLSSEQAQSSNMSAAMPAGMRPESMRPESMRPEAGQTDAPASTATKSVSFALAPLPVDEVPEEVSLDETLREQQSVTLVGFYVWGDVFVIPIDCVMEVIRYEEPFKLPMSPSFMSGVVNLRGRILPVVRLSDLLIEPGSRPETGHILKNSLIVICEAKGLQIGLLIDKLHTMFKVGQDAITWNAEAHLGSSAELLSGLMESGEKLLGIVSIERLVDKLLSE